MKKALLLKRMAMAMIILFHSSLVFSQTLASYSSCGGSCTTVTAGSPNVTVANLTTAGFGAGAGCTTGGLSGLTADGTTTYAPAGPHVYFKITPNAGYCLSATAITAMFNRDGTGPQAARFAYSLDNGSSWIDDATNHVPDNATCGGGTTVFSWAGGTLPSGVGSSGIIVALYAYNPSAIGGTFQVNTITVDGITQPTPTISLTSTPSTSSQLICQNTAIANISYTIGGGGTGATVTGLPPGVTASYSSGILTISGTANPTFSTSAVLAYNYTVTTTGGGCTAASATGNINVIPNANLTLTVPGSNVQTVCVGTPIANIGYSVIIQGSSPSITASGLPPGVSGVFTPGGYSISGTPTTAGVYTYTATTVGHACSGATATGTITVNPGVLPVQNDSLYWNFGTPSAATPFASFSSNVNVLAANCIADTGQSAGALNTSSYSPGYLTTLFSSSGYTGASGQPTVRANTKTGAFNAATSSYISFAITPQPGYAVTIKEIYFAAQRNSNTGPPSFVIRTSADGYGTTIGSGALANSYGTSKKSFTGLNVVGAGSTPLIVRVYAYSGITTATSGTLFLDDMVIYYTTSIVQAVCINTPITPIPYSFSTSTAATAAGLPAGVTGNFSGGVFTITGTPTVAGVYNYTVTATGGCAPVTENGSITVNGIGTIGLTSPAATATQTVCVNTPATNITYATGGTATSATVTGLPASITGSYSTGILTISGTPTVSGTFNYTVTTTGVPSPCPNPSLGGTINVNPNATISLSSAPGTDAQTVCTNSAITNITYTTSGATGATATGLPAGVTGSYSSGAFTISGTTTIAGIFSYTVNTTGSLCNSSSLTGTITVTPSATISLSSAPGTDAQTVCAGTAITNVIYNIGGPGTGATVTGLPTGVTSNYSTGVFTISGTPSVAGAYSYTITTAGSSCTSAAIATLTVNPLPAIPTVIIGTPATVCAGTSVLLSNMTPGGAWTSDNTSVATVNSTGNVTTLANGTATIAYTTSNSCGTNSVTGTVTVNPLPAVPGTINGTTTVCAGNTTALTNTTTGGIWTSSNTNAATINTTGSVSAIASGTSTIAYTISNSCGANSVTAMVTINPLPALPAPITGTPTTICAGSSTNLTDAIAGGVWSSSNTSVATVNATGHVSGIASGTSVIAYTIGNSCGTNSVTATITVNPLPAVPGTINGITTICAGNSTTLTNTTTGGIWTSSNTTIATINTAGSVSTIASGTSTIVYTISNSCGTNSATATITVTPLPGVPGTINGVTTICAGNTTALTNTTPGGTWTSNNTSIATVDVTGFVSGITNGTTTIAYTISNSCGTNSVTTAITINPLPAVPAAITGTPTTICIGSTTNLSDAVGGGVWSSSNTSVATVNATGQVSAVAGGTSMIVYTISNSCGTNSAATTITVNPTPAIPAAIMGTATVCAGGTTALTNTTPGGVWSSSDMSVATIDGTGIVTTLTSGTTTIAYTISNSCGSNSATAMVTVNPLPAMPAIITGTTAVCAGGITMLSNTIPGGAWSSTNTTVATVNAAGQVSALTGGISLIVYTIGNSCGSNAASITVTVNLPPLPPSAITGNTTVCEGVPTVLSSATSGGVWTSSNAGIATISSSGNVFTVSGGTSIIAYTISNSCGSSSITAVLTVISLPATPGPIAGITGMCIGSTLLLSNATPGGIWSSTAPGVATISAAGVVTGVATGNTTISYAVVSSCGTAAAIAIITVSAAPHAASIVGDTVICNGDVTYLSNSVSGGAWGTTAVSIVTVNATTGQVTGLSVGVAGVSYLITNSCGSSVAAVNVAVKPLPPTPVIIVSGHTLSTTVAYASYEWLMGGMSIPGATNATYIVTTTGLYSVIAGNSDGCTTISMPQPVSVVSVNSAGMPEDIRIYPNPTSAVLNIFAQEKVNIEIISIDGKVQMWVYESEKADVSNLSPGIYIIKLYDRNGALLKVAKFTRE